MATQMVSTNVESERYSDYFNPMPDISKYRDLLIVLPMPEPSIFRGIAVSHLRPVVGSNVEIDVVALNWVADVRKQIAAAFK